MDIKSPLGLGTHISLGGTRRLFSPIVAPIAVAYSPETFVLNTDMTIDKHFSAIHLYNSINQTSEGKNMFGILNYIVTGGSYTSGNIFGIYNFVRHAHNNVGASTTIIKAMNSQVDVGSDAASAYAIFATCTKGKVNAVADLFGAYIAAIAGYSAVNSATSLSLELKSASIATTIATGIIIDALWTSASGVHTWTDLKWIKLRGANTSGSTITTSYGIYADTSIDVGATKYFIYSESVSPSVLTGDLRLLGGAQLRLATDSTPASAGATGSKGDIKWDSSFIYVCVANNTWKRVAIATW